MAWECLRSMNKQLKFFLLLAGVVVASFIGGFTRLKVDAATKSPLIQSKTIIDQQNSPQAELAKASDLLAQELLSYPENTTALFLQGRVLQRRGLLDLSLKSYEKYFTSKSSDDFAANYNAGELSELKGDLISAERYFLGCIQVAPQVEIGWDKLIKVLLKQNRKSDAEGYFKSLRQLLPQSELVKRLSSSFTE